MTRLYDWLKLYFTVQPAMPELEDASEPLLLTPEELIWWQALQSGSEPEEELDPQSSVPSARPTSDVILNKPSNRARIMIGDDALKVLSSIVEHFGGSLTWEIRKTQAGTWAVFTPRMVREPLFLTTGGTYNDFLLCASLVTAFNTSHVLYTGQLDNPESVSAVRLT